MSKGRDKGRGNESSTASRAVARGKRMTRGGVPYHKELEQLRKQRMAQRRREITRPKPILHGNKPSLKMCVNKDIFLTNTKMCPTCHTPLFPVTEKFIDDLYEIDDGMRRAFNEIMQNYTCMGTWGAIILSNTLA